MQPMKAIGAILVAFMALQAPALASIIVVGVDNSNNCGPFACNVGIFFGDETLEQQQVYTSHAFAGASTVDAISFYLIPGQSGTFVPANYAISFYTTSAAVNGLSTNLSANRGTLLSNFGTYALAGSIPSTVMLTGNPFLYDPTKGNLLMDISVSDIVQEPFSATFFEAESGLTATSVSALMLNGAGEVEPLDALVTGFTTVPVTTPLPATLPLLGTGLVIALLFGGVGKARRSHVPTTSFVLTTALA